MSAETDEPAKGERALHKGIHWWRDGSGRVSFYDPDGGEWRLWTTGAGAPPLPPKWQLFGVPTRATRPGWRSPRRIIPAVLIMAAVGAAIYQSVAPSANNTTREAKASAALAGKCLAKSGPGFSSSPVPCPSAEAAVRVISVIPSTPGSPLCPPATKGVELAYPGVRYLHIECVVAAHPAPGTG